MKELKEIIARILEIQLKKHGFSFTQILELIEVPPSTHLGDFAFPAFKLTMTLKKDPKTIARELAEKIKPAKGIKKITFIGPYVNFFADENFLEQEILKKAVKKNYGKSPLNKGKKIVIEYSSPNTNKPLHIGHLRNNAIGMSIANLLELTQAKVIKVDLFNDRGIHICQSMLAYKKYGNNSTPQEHGLKSDHFVGKFYVMFHEIEKTVPELKNELSEMLVKWEKKDFQTLVLWKKMNKWAEKGFMQTYKNFKSKFDYRFYESKIYEKAKPIIGKGIEKKIFKPQANGAIVCDLELWGLGKKTILREDGTSIYITQDLAVAVEKNKKFHPDKSIYVVASEQNTYFKQLFKIIELLYFEWHSSLFHLSYGLVNLPEGKLKSREGKIIDADKLISDLQELAEKEIIKRNQNISKKDLKTRAQKIALAAIKFYMLKTDPAKNILFDPKQAILFEGDTGPYVQYTYARAKSILRKAKKTKQAKISNELMIEEKQVLSLIGIFEEKIIQSTANFDPSKTANYLLELCSAFNAFYHKFKVINENNEYDKTRLEIVKATANTIKNGLFALNIETMEEM